MTRRLRRLVAALLIPFVLVWSIMIPRQAYAFAPVGAAPIAIVGTLAGGAVVPIVVGVAISGLAYLAFKDLVSLDEVRVPAREGTAGQVPAPSAPATAEPVSGGCMYNSPLGGTLNVSAQGFVDAKNTIAQSGGPSCQWFEVVSENASSCSLSYCQRSNPNIQACGGGGCSSYLAASGGSQLTCPSGYTSSSGSCVLSNARVAVSDGKTDYERSGMTLNAIAGDQGGSLSSTTMTSNSTNDTVAVSGKDSAGNPMQGKIIAKTGGGSLVELKVQKQTAEGISYIETQKIETDANGNTIASAKTASAGTLTYDPANKTYTETAAPVGTIAPSIGGQTGTGTVTFPSDYARQGEAGSAAQSITNTLGPKIDAITQTGADPADPTQPQESEFDQAFFQGTFTNLLGWQLPAHTSQCPTSAFTFDSTSYTIDSHCQLVTNHFSALSAVMSVVWTVLALFILLGA